MASGGSTTMHQQHHGFDLPDPFRKFPTSVAAANVEFNDELSMASLLGGPGGDRSSPNGHHHHHHAHHHAHHHPQQHQHQQQYEDPTAYENPTSAYCTHNIFDVSASSASSTASSAFPTHFSSSSTTTTANGAGSQPSSLHETYQQHPSFNSTLPAINSTMRYDPPSPSSPQLPPANPPPSSFHPHHLSRHTPSPGSRSHSRSRPPSSSSAPPFPPVANGAGGVGPARTTRTRRNNSISGTSPAAFWCSSCAWTWEAACDCYSWE
ncbi:uncharacterized protein LACBIDRAFT_299392 [Laccaria bicolor S238N-H82]|uniref:Predicted protein n=1 Tax=Laccaria bicolor (strain S238N-H82 / ATCC MYA-4686) TaxID=486041 RepID=B0DEM2_LACBS|nr:uncharacterized protein LACBIDRAFT_299392 [Laccaria bicolor S238N-H82]EDR06960.1 predicted protein [Laccaria bicolor S238N-H82]|eukprot:XP_001882333.1 predicted protein [Laccaria bicolor S238N-H82]